VTNVLKATVLILEDEEIVRRSTSRILRGEGYEVLEAESAQQARAIVDGLRKPIALLLSDLELREGLQGREAANMLQSLRPEMRVLFMSGSHGAHHREQLEKAETFFLTKPFDRRRLLELVGFVLEGWKAPTA
jgi:two-component system cell cycle sensor histidine kinase/response regulator CckA